MVATDSSDIEANFYRYEDFIEVEDASKVTKDLVKEMCEEGPLQHSDWHVYERISKDKRDDLVGDERPAGSQIVQVGSAPINSPEHMEEYHTWYQSEHRPRLSKVQGWCMGTRWQFLFEHGDGKAPWRRILAQQQYEKENGLGGAQWKSSMQSEWSKRVISNVEMPSHRRTWEIVQ
ncbi:uncharacterized protein Z519_11253 [Cladophialophora bantiana CBS 173.52]|uniref:Uncharacterized protein n=1 Tax=Cladophialophora bantiana (strain ATCC 10958 / CBS 173.52 / CDC B-1940 / NIH 8579) TaxID=1442370 RepID=A0A0D2FN45_CLAB1|nr:uncharacterized protein Z519_11253 [Cladophialophora bantiana CBS 173.52]KIW88142.1 hypothetical protein Z519_11253 [Cladophialophora bantiana CBS 173.52]